MHFDLIQLIARRLTQQRLGHKPRALLSAFISGRRKGIRFLCVGPEKWNNNISKKCGLS